MTGTASVPPIPGTSNAAGAVGGNSGVGPGRPKAKRIVVSKYTRHACNQCKKAKTKCEGKPVCDRCLKTGHDCVWVEDNRKALTRHHEQALRHQNGVLRAEVDALKAELTTLKIQVTAPPAAASPGVKSPPTQTEKSVGSNKANPSLPSSSEQSDLDAYSSSSAIPRNTNSVNVSTTGSGNGNGNSNGNGTAHPALYTAYPDVHMDEPVTSQPAAHRPTAAPTRTSAHGIPRRDPFFGEGGVGMDMYDFHHSGSDFDYSSSDGDGDSSDGDDSSGGSGSFEDSSDEDSDGDLDRALVAGNKTLFSEHDGFQLYGLTSVFRLRKLRRRTSTHTVRNSRRKRSSSSHARPPSSGGYISSSSHLKEKHGRPRSRANSSGTATSGRFIVPKDKSRNSSRVRSGGEREREREREYGRRKGKGRGKGKGRARKVSREPSPVRTARHALLIADPDEGGTEVDKGCGCQSDCWSRWLPKDAPLTRREHDVLLDRLFLFFSSWCMRIIPEYFLRDMHTFLHSASSTPGSNNTPLPRLTHYSPFLHNTLLAVATAFSSDPEVRRSETRQRFADEAKSYIEAECSRPSVSAVQALGMLASYYSGKGQQTLGFMYFGMSTRIAQALGLGADCTPLMLSGRLRPQQMWDRLWCFHMGCAQDACWSLYVGREFGVPLGGGGRMDDPLGLLDVAEGVGERLDWMVWRSRSGNHAGVAAGGVVGGDKGGGDGGGGDGGGGGGEEEMETEEGRNEKMGIPQCRTFTVFLWSCQLMKISRRIMDLMNRLATTDGGTEIKLLVADIDIELVAWRENLPLELKLTPSNEASALPHKLMMHLAYWWLLILLHRPFYQRQRMHTVDLSFSVGRCNLAAREILSILRLWRKTYGTVRFAPITLIQCAFSCGTIYILQALQAAMGRRPATVAQGTALDHVHELVGILRESGQSWECALRIADTFERLVQEQRRILEGGGSKRSGRRKRKATITAKLTNAGEANNAATTTADSGSASAQTPEMAAPPDIAVAQGAEEDTAQPFVPLQPVSETEDTKSFVANHGIVPHAFPFFFPYNQMHSVSPVVDSPSTDNDQQFPPYGPQLHASPSYSYAQHHNHHSHNHGHHQPVVSSTEAHHAHLSADDDSSDSQYVSADDQDHPMSNNDADAADASDFNFIYNAEINMDAIMPGLGLFDPTGLGGAGGLAAINSMGFGMNMGMNSMGGGMGLGVGNAMTVGTEVGFGDPSAYGMHYVGFGHQHAGHHGHHTSHHGHHTGHHGHHHSHHSHHHHHPVAGNSSGHNVLTSGHAGTYNAGTYGGDMDFTSDGEDRALYDMIASLNNEVQPQQHF